MFVHTKLRLKHLALFLGLLIWATFASAQVPQSDHVFLLMEENHSYEQVLGNPNAPYLNSLAQTYGLATNYDANSHYSIPNYFWVTTGAFVTTSDGTTQKFNVDNVTRYLLTAGKTWKAYEESLPYAGYVGPSTGAYEKNHNPFSYLTDVANSSQSLNMVPFTQLATDAASSALPNYGFITPNGNNDGHNSNLSVVDQWLKNNLPPLLASAPFQPGGNGILFITFDESVNSDCRPLTSCPHLPENGGGGRVATIVISPMAKSGYQASTFYQHPSILRTMMLALGITGAPGAAATAPDMAEFFGTSPPPPPTPTVTINAPGANATVSSPVSVSGGFNGTATQYMKLWVDGVSKYTVPNSATLNTTISLSAGKHKLTVQAYNGTLYSTAEYITVQ